MLIKPRDFNAVLLMFWMFYFNPGKIDIYPSIYLPRHLISFVPINELKFPDDWYYCNETSTIKNYFSQITVLLVINL